MRFEFWAAHRNNFPEESFWKAFWLLKKNSFRKRTNLSISAAATLWTFWFGVSQPTKTIFLVFCRYEIIWFFVSVCCTRNTWHEYYHTTKHFQRVPEFSLLTQCSWCSIRRLFERILDLANYAPDKRLFANSLEIFEIWHFQGALIDIYSVSKLQGLKNVET